MTEHPADRDVERLADDLEREADRLERRSNEIGGHIDEARDEWERRRNDPSVPGAQPPQDEDDAQAQDGESPAGGAGSPAG